MGLSLKKMIRYDSNSTEKRAKEVDDMNGTYRKYKEKGRIKRWNSYLIC